MKNPLSPSPATFVAPIVDSLRSIGRKSRRLSLPLLGLLLAAAAQAEPLDHNSVAIRAVADTAAPSITLEVEALRDLSAYSVDVARRTPEATSWTSLGPASQGATPYDFTYTDTSVSLGEEYEYRIEATLSGSPTVRGFTAAAVGLERFDDRGKLILVVENSKRTALNDAIDAYKADLVGDGWEVYEITAPSHTDYPTVENAWTDADNPAVALRNQIRSTITSAGDNPDNPSDFKQVILLGHVQIPYSGWIAPDGHGDHSGAWPADVYYGDLDGTYTDDDVNTTSAIGTRNDNVGGDGKFDQSEHEDYELAVGRVSLHDMSAFGSYTETQLLANYLDKVHRYRRGLLRTESRGLATWQWQWNEIGRDWAPHVAINTFPILYGWEGTDYRVGSSFRETLREGSYEWAVTASAGGNSGNAWSKTNHYPDNDQQALFFAHFGSYLGDWDQGNNLLRAPLAQKDWGLTAFWAARPHTSFQAMTLDNSIGETHKRSLNFGRPEGGDLYDYATPFYNRMVHHGLMGDPTLRRHIIAPPQQLQVTADGSGGFDLNWEATPADVDGYHVYRAPTMDAPFTRLTGTSPITGTTYNDATPGPVGSIYMVRAVRLEESRGGSFWNASQGIFSGAATHNTAPRITGLTNTQLPALQGILKPEVMDDGQPDPNTGLSFSWTLDSGPGTLSFDDASLRNPTVTASTTGVYTVSVTADDGALSDTISFDLLIGEGAAPVVDAGPDIRGADQLTVRLDGRVGREPANSNLSTSWALAEVYPASGQATFADATAPQTAVTFTEAGIYTLRLRATLSGQHFDDFCTVYVQPAAISVGAVPTSGLYQFFNFENATSDTIFDQSPTDKDSSIENGATITPEGYIGQAIDFGSKRIPHTLTKDFFRRDQNESFAIAHWIRFDNSESSPRRFAQVYQFMGMGELYFSGNDTLTFKSEMSGNDGEWSIDLNATLGGWPSGTWEHFAVSFDGADGLNDATFYLNGVAIPATEVSAPSGSSVNRNIGRIRMGHRRYTDYALFDGQLDEFRAYNRALSTAEVQALARQKTATGSVRRPAQQEASVPNNRDVRFHLDFDAPVENLSLADITVRTEGGVTTDTPVLETLIDKRSFLVRVPVLAGTGAVTLEVDASGIDDPANGVSAQMRTASTSVEVAADDGLTPPTADAGLHQSLTDSDKDGSVTFDLDAGGSSDADGSIVGYEWFDASGQSVATGATPSLTLPTGNHTLTLRVTDNDGAAAIDLIGLEAVAPPNQAPVADAGADFVQTDTGNDSSESVTLDGTASTDPDGDGISAYEWRIDNSIIATGATPSVTLNRGLHTIQLMVTDGRGATASDFVEVDIVRAPENPVGTEVGLNFEYYEDEWTTLPDFDNLTEVAFGPVSDFDLSVRQKDAAFGLRYTGFLEIPGDAEYTFTLESSNGAKLYLGDALIVDNDGLSEVGNSSAGTLRLGAGTHAITLDYFKAAASAGGLSVDQAFENDLADVSNDFPVRNESGTPSIGANLGTASSGGLTPADDQSWLTSSVVPVAGDTIEFSFDFRVPADAGGGAIGFGFAPSDWANASVVNTSGDGRPFLAFAKFDQGSWTTNMSMVYGDAFSDSATSGGEWLGDSSVERDFGISGSGANLDDRWFRMSGTLQIDALGDPVNGRRAANFSITYTVADIGGDGTDSPTVVEESSTTFPGPVVTTYQAAVTDYSFSSEIPAGELGVLLALDKGDAIEALDNVSFSLVKDGSNAPAPSLNLTYASAEAGITEQAIPAGDLSRLSAGDFPVSVEQAAAQGDPVGNPSEVRFTATFDQPVIDFAASDVNVTGTTGADIVSIQEVAPNAGTTYEITVSGFTSDGTVSASIPALSASTAGGLTNRNSNASDNTVEVFTGLDGNPPEVVQTNPLSDTSMELVFDEPLTTASAETTANYAADNGLSITDASLAADRLTVTLTTSAQTPNTNYTLTLNGITDLAGLVIPSNTTASFTSQSSILLWYDFDDGSGTTVSDKAGSRDATVSNPDWRPNEGLQDGALYFDGSGSSEVVEANAETYLAGLSAVTITAMVKSEVTNTDRGCLTTLAPNGKGESINMRFDTAGWSGGGSNLLQMGLTTDQGDSTVVETPSGTQTTEWLHVALVWSSGSPVRVFLDGQEVTPSNATASQFNDSLTGTIADITQDADTGVDQLLLGKGPKGGGSSGWQGWIDDFRIYDEALADAEITALNDGLRATPATTYTLTTSAANGQVTLSPDGPDFSEGTVVNVEAVPDTGYRFVDFTGALSGSTNPQSITMGADQSVTANFEPDPATLDGFLAENQLDPSTAITDDSDADGTALLLEHFFGTDPNRSDRPATQAGAAQGTNGPVFEVLFERNRHASDVTHSYEAYDVATGQWNPISPQSESTGSAEHPDRETVTAEFPMDRDRLLMRMRVRRE